MIGDREMVEKKTILVMASDKDTKDAWNKFKELENETDCRCMLLVPEKELENQEGAIAQAAKQISDQVIKI